MLPNRSICHDFTERTYDKDKGECHNSDQDIQNNGNLIQFTVHEFLVLFDQDHAGQQCGNCDNCGIHSSLAAQGNTAEGECVFDRLGVFPVNDGESQFFQFCGICYRDLIGTVKAVTDTGRLAHRTGKLGISHEISGFYVQIDGECLAIDFPNAVKIGFQSVVIFDIAVPGQRIISQVLGAADIFSYINIRYGLGFSLIGVCNGEGELLLRYLRLLNRVTQKQQCQRCDQVYDEDDFRFLEVFGIHIIASHAVISAPAPKASFPASLPCQSSHGCNLRSTAASFLFRIRVQNPRCNCTLQIPSDVPGPPLDRSEHIR